MSPIKSLACVLALVAAPATYAAGKSCDELKSEIATRLDEKKVAGYTLEVVETEKVGDKKVVGSCEGGTKKIVYARS